MIPIVTAKAVATLDRESGGRFVFGIGFGWNADEIEHHGVDMKAAPRRRPRARARDEGTVARRHRVVRRRVRAHRAVVVVAQARRAVGHRSSSAARRDRSCSRTSPSTPTAGSRSAARACAPRSPTSAVRARSAGVIRRRCASSRSARFPMRASSSTTRRSASKRSCCASPVDRVIAVLPELDRLAELIE